MSTGGNGGSKEYARRPAERRLRKRRRASPSEGEADAAASQFLRTAPSSERDLRDALAHSRGDSTAGIVLGLQRAYGNKAVAGLLQRQKTVDASASGEDVPSQDAADETRDAAAETQDAAAESGERVPSVDASATGGVPSNDVAQEGGGVPARDASGGGASASSADQPIVRLGSSGAAVSQLQAILNSFGASPLLKVDGAFGPATKSAVVSFQRQRGLAPDGVVGPKTWGALYGTQPTFGKDASEQPVPEGATVGSETPEQEAVADLSQGHKLYDSGDLAGALVYYRRVYSLPEASARARGAALYDLADCYQHLGQKEQAASAWEELLAMPETKSGDHALALEHLRELRTGEGWRSAEDILKPPTPEEQAAADAQALVELNAGHAVGHAGDSQGALTHFENAYAVRYASPRVRLAAAAYSGLMYQRLGEFDKALDILQEALGFPEGAFDQAVGDVNPVSRESVLLTMRDARAGKADSTQSQPPIPASEVDAKSDEAHELYRAGQYAAALAILEGLYVATDDAKKRAQIAVYLGQCHQQLGSFDKAVSLFMEVLGMPGLGEADRADVLELLRQARMHEVGTHVTAAEPGTGQATGGLEELFQGEVFFETGKAEVNSIGQSTIDSFAALVNQRMKAEPTEITVTIVGHASPRWRSAAGDTQRHELNEKLAAARAETVEGSLMPKTPDPAFTYIRDSTGDEVGQKVTANSSDNTWFFRSVTIIAERKPTAT